MSRIVHCPRCGRAADVDTARSVWVTVIVGADADGYLFYLDKVCPGCVTEADRATDLRQVGLDARARWSEHHVEEDLP